MQELTFMDTSSHAADLDTSSHAADLDTSSHAADLDTSSHAADLDTSSHAADLDTSSHAADLDMMQITDSMFPTGLFATSNGLESLFLDGVVTTSGELAEFNRTCIRQQVGPCDCIILANACKAAEASDRDTIRKLDTLSWSVRMIRETREVSVRAGGQLARCVGGFAGGEILDWWNAEIQGGRLAGAYPVSFGVCCDALKIGTERAVLMLLYGFVAGNVGAALRLGMIQHLEGQDVIHSLKPLITETARRYADVPASEVWQFAPQTEINQMRHEKAEAKMFIT